MVIVADGTEQGDGRLQRVLTADPGTGVMRHADAGYELAIETARERGVDLPMLDSVTGDVRDIETSSHRAVVSHQHRVPRHLPRRRRQGDIHVIPDAALAWEGDRIRWVGPACELPGAIAGLTGEDAGGRLVFPGLVDCHTHLAFGGWRADEFEQRLRGASYLEIAARAAASPRPCGRPARPSEADLDGARAGSCRRCAQLGVTTVECKSGYGLDRDTELRLLRVYRRLAAARPVTARADLPRCARRAGRVSRATRGVRRAAHRRHDPAMAARAAWPSSATCSWRIGVHVEEARAHPRAPGSARGLRPKLHADQLTDGGGAELAAEVGALSADHLEHASDGGHRGDGRGGRRGGEPAARHALPQPAARCRRAG